MLWLGQNLTPQTRPKFEEENELAYNIVERSINGKFEYNIFERSINGKFEMYKIIYKKNEQNSISFNFILKVSEKTK